MDSKNDLEFFEDNRMRESEQSPPSRHRNRKDSESSSRSGKRDGKFHKDVESSLGDRARTRTREPKRDPDQDQISDEEHSRASFYSDDDYENASLSERSFSPQSPSPSAHRAVRTRRVSSSPLHRTGVRKGVSRRPGPQAYHSQLRSSGLRSQSLSKDAPPKDLDLVTKRLLSARLLKISELKNALSELRSHSDELQRENRLLRQLQLRHEKALQRYSDTESEISQLISRHNNETHALRERLRRSQERERTAERSYRDADAQLQRCRSQLQKLQQLADDQHLGEREELTRKLTHSQAKAQESERRIKELEKNIELSNGSFQRQLASERRKTHDAMQEVQALREEAERLSAKLKEKERELDARNIYANRIKRAASKKESENPNKRKGPISINSKAVQTEDRALSLDFPSPPPAVADCNEFPTDDQVDDYLSLKVRRPALNQSQRIKKQEQQSSEQMQKEAKEWRTQELEREREKERAQEKETERAFEREREREKERERLREKERESEKEKDRSKVEKQIIDQEINSSEEKGARSRDGWDRGERNRKRWSQYQSEEEEKKSHEQEEEDQWMRDQEILVSQERAEEECQRKEQLLAKMREIDMQTQGQDSDFFSDDTGSIRSPPRLSEPRNQNASIFSFTEPDEGLGTAGVGKRGGALRTQKTSQELDFAFGSYEPSFGKPASRASFSHRNQSQPSGQLPGEGDAGLNLSGLVKERKSNLMQQLFGSTASSPPPDLSRKMELLSSAGTAKLPSGAQSVRRRDAETPNGLNIKSKSVLQVSESRPAVRAITSFDDDIEEVTL